MDVTYEEHGRSKRVIYTGASGYWPRLFTQGIQTIARNLPVMNRATTAVIRGLSSPVLQSRRPGIVGWGTDGPVEVALLKGGTPFMPEHGQIVVLPCDPTPPARVA
jgi:hypothetical protein